MKTILEFYTPTCGQCPRQEEILSELAADRDDVTLETVDATEETDRANRFGVRSVPTTVVLDDDDEILQQFVGLTRGDHVERAL